MQFISGMLSIDSSMNTVHFQLSIFINSNRSEFSNERNRVDRRVQYYKCRNRKQFIEDMSSYLDWITQAGFILYLFFSLFALLFNFPSLSEYRLISRKF